MLLRGGFAVILIFAAASFAQTAPCNSLQFPISAIDGNGSLLRGLAPADFRAQVGRRQLRIKSVEYDDGPRRVVLVVDTAKKLPAEARRAEQIMVETILAAARPQDSVALVTARGAERTIKFGEERAGFVQTLAEQDAPKQHHEGGVLDSVLEAFELLGTPQSGDAIVVFAQDLEGNRKTSAKAVSRLLASRHTRMFGVALGPVMTQNPTASTSEWAGTRMLPYAGDAPYHGGDEDFYWLTRDSGGVVVGAVNFNAVNSPNISDPAFQARLKQKARSVFDIMAGYYRMELDAPIVGDWNLGISDAIRKVVPTMFLLYPHQLAPCAK
jgi:hypothetical protein